MYFGNDLSPKVEFYVLLSFLTFVIFALGLAIWRKTREIGFPLGIGFLYYWSLFGAWSIITDRLGGDSGMHYDYLELKMFTVKLDSNYAKTLVLYALFVVVVEVVLLAAVKRKLSSCRTLEPLRISHRTILVVSAIAGLASYWIVSGSLEAASALNVSAYSELRGGNAEAPSLFTLHQILNRVGLVPSAIGFVVLCSGRKPRFLSGSGNSWTVVAYLAILAAMAWFCFLLGNKNELFLAGTAGLLFYLANAERPKKVLLGGVALAGLLGLGLLDSLRGVPVSDLTSAVREIDASQMWFALKFIATSDEAFGAHLSMYGALSKRVPLTYGSSFVSLAASAIPRAIWPSRPQDIYYYYAERVGAEPGQGYTIHHATGWYLNFGIPGIVLGAAIVGWFWAKCSNWRLSVMSRQPQWIYCLKVLAPPLFVAFIPGFVRAGPEAFKAMILDAFLIPVFVIAWSARSQKSAEVRMLSVAGRGASIRAVGASRASLKPGQ